MTLKKYNIIYADPPWSYNDKLRFGPGAACKYDVMTTEQIKSLPIPELAAENCALFLWATWPLINEGFEVLKAWGFEYKTCAFVWVKTRENGSIHLGLGKYTRSNSEFVLLGMRGKLKVLDNSVSQIIISRVREHSRKPDLVADRIVRLFGDLPRIELFARRKRFGWDVWGNDHKLEIETL